MQLLLRINRVVNQIVGGFGIAVCIGLVVMTVSDIVMRYFFNRPYSFSFEVTQLALVLIVFSFIPYSTSQLRHVSIEVLVERFNQKQRFYLDLTGDIFCAFMFLLICRQSFLEGRQQQLFGSITGELEIPLFPFYYFVSFGVLLSALSLVLSAAHSIADGRKDQ